MSAYTSHVVFKRDNKQSLKKTKVWNVRSRYAGGVFLGTIKFKGGWWRYCFHPATETLFDQECLETIANFCGKQTGLWRKGKSKNVRIK